MGADALDRLRTLEVEHARLDGQIERIAEAQERLSDVVERIDHRLQGNGTPGIITRLDRIEQSLGTARKLVVWLLGIAGSVAVGLLLAHFG